MNGKNHLHEARSDVMRCFFYLTRTGQFILTPSNQHEMQEKIQLRGKLIDDFQDYFETAKFKKGPILKEVDLEETKRDYRAGKVAGPLEVVLLTLHIGLDLVKDLFKDYLKTVVDRKVHAAKVKFVNDRGEELNIELNKLSIEEIYQLIDDFKGRIVEVNT